MFKNKFGNSKYLFFYFIGLFLLETLIPLLVQLILSIVSVYKFKRLMYRLGHLTRNQTEARKAEVRFTKTIFICVASL